MEKFQAEKKQTCTRIRHPVEVYYTLNSNLMVARYALRLHKKHCRQAVAAAGVTAVSPACLCNIKGL